LSVLEQHALFPRRRFDRLFTAHRQFCFLSAILILKFKHAWVEAMEGSYKLCLPILSIFRQAKQEAAAD